MRFTHKKTHNRRSRHSPTTPRYEPANPAPNPDGLIVVVEVRRAGRWSELPPRPLEAALTLIERLHGVRCPARIRGQQHRLSDFGAAMLREVVRGAPIRSGRHRIDPEKLFRGEAPRMALAMREALYDLAMIGLLELDDEPSGVSITPERLEELLTGGTS